MGLFDSFKKAAVRSLENPNAPVSAENFQTVAIVVVAGFVDFVDAGVGCAVGA